MRLNLVASRFLRIKIFPRPQPLVPRKMSTATSPTQGNVPSIFKWAQTDGEFRRQTSSFRNYVTTDPKAQFIAEANRYHLYVSLACPWVSVRSGLSEGVRGSG